LTKISRLFIRQFYLTNLDDNLETIPKKMAKSLKLPALQTRKETARLKLMHAIIYGTKIVNKKSLPQQQRCADLRF